MTDELLAAHRAGDVEVAIGRASDYFGPGATHSALGETVFGTALAGRRAQVMGDPDQPHSYSYTPDVATGLVTLGLEPSATGSVWHLPVADTRTTRDSSSTTSTPWPATGPGASPPDAPRSGSRACSSRRCGSTCTRCTSSPTAGSSTTPSSAPPSATSPRRSTTALATTFSWYRSAAPANAAATTSS